VPKGRPYNPNCVDCGILKTKENTYASGTGGLGSLCKSCDKTRSIERKRNRKLGIIPVKKHNKKNKRSYSPKEWVKSNKNHYPDPDWVWRQIELGEGGAVFMEKLEQKYALSKHGNSGKNNRWKNK